MVVYAHLLEFFIKKLKMKLKQYKFYLFLLITSHGCIKSITGSSDGQIYNDIFIDPGKIDTMGCFNRICDIDPQCGCPEGTMCTIVPGLGRGCAIAGTGKDGAPCTLLECAPGYLCQNGLCRKACRSDSDCPQIGACYKYVGNGEYKVCNIVCNHVTNEGCPEGYRCDYVIGFNNNNHLFGFHDCNILEGNGKQLDNCTIVSWENPDISPNKDCAPGYFCSDNNCFKFCLNPGALDPICDSFIFPCCGGWGIPSVDGIPIASCTYPKSPPNKCN